MREKKIKKKEKNKNIFIQKGDMQLNDRQNYDDRHINIFLLHTHTHSLTYTLAHFIKTYFGRFFNFNHNLHIHHCLN